MEQPIHVRLVIGTEVRELTTVGDPADSFLAWQIGRAVSVAVLEIGSEQ